MRKALTFAAVVLLAGCLTGKAQVIYDFEYREAEYNYDEAKVPQYTLPDVLTCTDGTKVKNVKDWENKRRPELLEILRQYEYGRVPEGHIDVSYKTISVDSAALEGKAVSKQVMLTFSNGSRQVNALLLMYIPLHREGRVPVIFGYNFAGNNNTTLDPNVRFSPSIPHSAKGTYERGLTQARWSYDRAIGRGYAVATMCYEDITKDHSFDRSRGVASLFPNYKPDIHKPDEWGSISIWAWGASRVADYLETQDWADTDCLAILGHSRLGKVALWAGAQDTRFKVVLASGSGCGGAALHRRMFGENIYYMSHMIPSWFCPAYRQFAHDEQSLPFDQHELIALIAPRHVFVASASEDLWADPKGEFLSVYHASPVYKLYGMKGIKKPVQPEVHQPIMTDVAYTLRKDKHNITDYEWQNLLDFCDKHMKHKK